MSVDQSQRNVNSLDKDIANLEKKNKAVLNSYQARIDELQGQLRTAVALPVTSPVNGPMEEYDVFVSHAFEDKEDFVDDLVAECESLI